MSKGALTEKEIEILKENPNVVNVNATRITYSEEFKQHFVSEYRKGLGPTQIFRNAGFDTKILGEKRIERAAARWRKVFDEPLNRNNSR